MKRVLGPSENEIHHFTKDKRHKREMKERKGDWSPDPLRIFPTEILSGLIKGCYITVGSLLCMRNVWLTFRQGLRMLTRRNTLARFFCGQTKISLQSPQREKRRDQATIMHPASSARALRHGPFNMREHGARFDLSEISATRRLQHVAHSNIQDLFLS